MATSILCIQSVRLTSLISVPTTVQGHLPGFLELVQMLNFRACQSMSHLAPSCSFSPSLEHNLGSEVLLLDGVVAHAHLQHPLGLHHLYILHVLLFLIEGAVT